MKDPQRTTTSLRTLTSGAYFFLGVAFVISLAACSSVENALSGRAERPGEGTTVYMGQATWETGWFQAQIYKALLEELGYEVNGPHTLFNIAFYIYAGQGDIDLWVNGWFPLHDAYFDYEQVQEQVIPVGFEIDDGALQGYLIDKATADRLGITNLGDLEDPEIAAIFDVDGDGKADLTGCNEEWRCDEVIDHHLQAFGLNETVTQIKGSYSELMLETVARFENNEPILFYTWTPNWTVSELVIGEDVMWLSVPFSTSPDSDDVNTVMDSITGCLESPCDMGFRVADIRAVANVEFLTQNPSAAALLEAVKIPLLDISLQNALMSDGENSEEDLRRHAVEWIANNRELVDQWLAVARDAQ